MKQLLISFIKVLFAFLDSIIPKKNNYVVFGSSHGNSNTGNSQSLYEYMRDAEECQCRFYLRRTIGDAGYISYKSLNDIWFFLRAKVVVFTHGKNDFYPLNFSSKKVSINLWHGVPLKGMGLAQKKRDSKALTNAARGKDFDYFLASSKFMAHSMNYCLNGDDITYLLTGQPRNDRFKRVNVLPKKDNAIKILYAPTWREFGSVEWFPFDSFNIEKLNTVLVDLNATILLRPHVNDDMNFINSLIRSNIQLADSSVFPEVNDLLGGVDCLITDYSSIYIDYLLLNRPIIFLQYDFKEYVEYNSLMYDDNEFWFPGEKPKEFNEFLSVIQNVCLGSNDNYLSQRTRINELFNYYEDGNANKKIANFINKGDFSHYQRELVLK